MSMSRPAPPFSPLSMSSNDSSFVGRYESISGTPGGTASDAPYTGGPYGAARPPGTSPPSSQHPSSSTDMSRPSMAGSSVNGNRPPSSASSIAMSSDGRMGMGRPPPGDREGSRGQFKDDSEIALQRHYTALKSYLQVHLQDEKGNIKPNRARDKLLRLSVTQFMELSTDVYDELIRREDERTQRVDNVPRFLLPKQNFHPKRNQARQKLSTLPIERFRQLATDVFYELERRIPRIVAGDMGPRGSIQSNASGRSRAQSRGGMRPPGPGYGYPPGPPGPGRGRGYPPGPYGPGPGMGPGGPRRPSEAGSLGRPLPKHLQSNTIVPNKGTMVEDDDEDDDEDAFGLDHVGSGLSARPSIAEDAEKIQAQEAEIAELKEKLAQKESAESEWSSTREELEQKHECLQQELAAFQAKSRDEDEIREQHDINMQTLRDQLDELHEELQSRSQDSGDLKLLQAQLETHQAENVALKRQLQEQAMPGEFEQRIQELESELATQQKISQEVREEATSYLREMRDLSRQNDQAIEQEEKMAAKISQLEKENNEWRQRYTKVKAQNKSLRASTMGLGLQTGFDSGSLVRQEGLISEGGLVRDTDVTRFQLAVDELLKVARQASTEAMLESVKSVVVSVQSITSSVRTEGYPTPSPSPSSPATNMQQAPSVSKIQARVTGTANSLITATKQHAASHGLSPVALLDAAASNLTAAVVELIKAVHIRPSNKADFQDLDGVDELNSFYDDSASPSTSQNPNGLQIPVPTFPAPPPAPPSESKAIDPATLPVRKASTKKPNGGWFGWAGKWNDDSNEAPPTANGASATHHYEDSDDEYDPYR